MQFSEQWLREWVNPGVSSETLSEQLTMAGLEVDAMEAVAPDFSGIVVAEVLEVEPHPDADKLRVCKVNVGEEEPLTIVCGAANVRPGLHVPAALVGAVLPGNFKIKKAKLRGVPSFGMLCSEQELGLAESAEGLMELPTDSPVGEDIRRYLQLDDQRIELGLTPNRGDCLSIGGIAREVGVLNSCDLTPPAIEPVANAISDVLPITIEADADCPRYVGRIIRNVNPEAQTPLWMQEKLRRSGIRSLGPMVDVTNFVLIELGQPMHAFDLARVNGGITVRRGREGEKLALLNDTEIMLDDQALVIADDSGALALAGIMGGSTSAVADNTRDILLESAFFTPASIAGRARRYGLHTDSSHRFERGVDPMQQRRAIERATALLLTITGGEAGPVIECGGNITPPPTVVLRHARVERVLGAEISREKITGILQRLAMQITTTEEGWEVNAPSFRFDITREEDLIEEVGRIVGYSNLPSHPPSGKLSMLPNSEKTVARTRLRQALIERGYQEAITYSFVEPNLQKLMAPGHEGIALANPISSDMSVMRTSLWPGLIQALQHNLNRQQERVRLFESGMRFVKDGVDLKQDNVISGVIYGPLHPEQWASESRPVDFFDLKGDVEAVLSLGYIGGTCRFVAEAHPALHPGRSARVYAGSKTVGWLGEIHPLVKQKLGLAKPAYLFELELMPVSQGFVPKFSEISKFPAIRRDIAIVLEQAISIDSVRECIMAAAPETLCNLKLFDVYQGEHIDSGRKSLALGLTLQAQSRTLTDEEVDNVISAILSRLSAELGATLRE